jgi:hypothetical protein
MPAWRRWPPPPLAAVACLLMWASVSGCSGINSQTNSFATLAEARAAGAIERGWLPEGLPAGTHDIREAHVPGSRDRWGIVNFPPEEAGTLRELLQSEELPLGGLRTNAPGRIEWWPLVLRGRIDGERTAATGLRGYRPRQGDLIFAVNWRQGRAYYWTAQ